MTSFHSYRRWAAAGAVLIIGICAYSLLAADTAQTAETAVTDFTGKFVVLIIDQSSAVERRQNTEVLENAKMVQIGGRHFIVGKAYTPEGVGANWRTGSELGVAWDKVHVYYTYTPEAFKSYSKRWSEAEGKDKDDK